MIGRTQSVHFEIALDQFLAITAPIARAITCLESTHSTVSDVYAFWLAVTATIHQIIIENSTEIPNSVLEQVRRAVNRRFDQMVNEAPFDIYLTGFVLDPRKQYQINSYKVY